MKQTFRLVPVVAFESLIKRRPTFRFWNELEQSQWLSRNELEARQFDALQKLLRHAAATCPYYRKSWQELGLDADRLQNAESFAKWPIVDRDVVRENRFDMRSDLPGLRLISKATGGSSGVPLQFDLDPNSNDRRMAAWHRGYSWAGAAPGTKQLYLWGVVLGERPLWREWKDRFYNWIYRRQILNCFDLREDRAGEFNRAISRCRPEVIVAYTNALYALARAFDDQGLKPHSPRSIVVGAEKLHDFQRVMIERVFQAPVFETYGSREFMLMGAECDCHEGLHLTMENLHVEVLDDDGQPTPDGKEGNVVVTDLYNYGMPFIRYANGDRAIAGWGQCSCGRGLPTLKKVIGRRLDIVTTPDGRQVPGEFFPHLLKDYPAVRQFQVLQETPDAAEIRLVLSDSWNELNQRSLERQLRETLGDAIELKINQVDEIPLTKSGKLQVVVNLCGRTSAAEYAPSR